MKKVLRLTEADLTKLIKRIVNESDMEKKLELRSKLNDMFFGNDSFNVTSEPGEFGYLSQEHRLRKKISPKQRVSRIEDVIEQLEDYITDLKDIAYGEGSFISNPEYDSIWKDIDDKN